MGCIKHRKPKRTCLFADGLFLAGLFLVRLMYRVCIANMPFRHVLEQCNRLEDLEKQSKKQDSAKQTKKNGSSIRTKKHLKNIEKNTLKSLQNPSRMSGMNLLPTPSEFLGLTTVQAGQKARFLDPHFGAKITPKSEKKATQKT